MNTRDELLSLIDKAPADDLVLLLAYARALAIRRARESELSKRLRAQQRLHNEAVLAVRAYAGLDVDHSNA